MDRKVRPQIVGFFFFFFLIVSNYTGGRFTIFSYICVYDQANFCLFLLIEFTFFSHCKEKFKTLV